MKAKFDMPKLERSLKRFSKDFGETSAQAVVRWSVQVCRELAFETQPFGTRGTKKTQEGAIYTDAYRVIYIPDRIPKATRNKKFLASPEAVNDWIESNRRGKGKRCRLLPIADRKICSAAVLKSAVKQRMTKAGIAKGGFIGAGQDIAKAQTGSEKIQIGRNFLSYAQKHSAFGSARKPQEGFKPAATINNSAAHTSSDYVLKRGSIDKALRFGLSKTVNWYRRTIKALDKKKP